MKMTKPVKRVEIILTKDERTWFESLRPIQDDAVYFWRRVAKARFLDPRSVLTEFFADGTTRTTALALGHGKHWCYPMRLECNELPAEADSDTQALAA